MASVNVLDCLVLVCCLAVVSCKGPHCYMCSKVSSPHDCGTVQRCNQTEQCQTKKFIDSTRTAYYALGCGEKEVCTRNSISIVGKRDSNTTGLLTRQASDRLVSMHCCEENHCNRNLYGSSDLSQLSMSQVPNPGYEGNEVKMVCVVTTGTPPILIDWTVDSVTFSVRFSDCAYVGATESYTPGGCGSVGNEHTMEMTIASASTSDSGKQWNCTASGASSPSVTTNIQMCGSVLTQSPNPATVGNDVNMVCVVTSGTVPGVIQWVVDSVTYYITFPECVAIGGSISYTPQGCATSGTLHTMEMAITAASLSENGKVWTCTSCGSSSSVTADIQDATSPGVRRFKEAILKALSILHSKHLTLYSIDGTFGTAVADNY